VRKGSLREYPQDVVDFVCDMYTAGATVGEVKAAAPKGFRVDTILNRYLPSRRGRGGARAQKAGPASPFWLDRPRYRAAHVRTETAKGKAATHPCIDCGEPAAEWSYVHACPDEMFAPYRGAYCPHPDHYVARCVLCHRAYDRKEVTQNC